MYNRPMKILIVDDERSNLEILSHILKPGSTQNGEIIDSFHAEYTLCVAKSGASALKKAAEESPDLILMDIVMPCMNGFEVLEALKASEVTRGIPVICITGLDSVQDEEKGFALGAVDYITKPFHGSLVRARVKTQLRLVEQMRTIEMLGLMDTLTGIPNRRGFDNQITTEWTRAARDKNTMSLLMLDIDHFKRFNDTYGHQQGDEALLTVARVLTRTLKRPADFAARWGGEEFAVILPDTDIDGALNVAEGVRKHIEAVDIFNLRGASPLKVTVSVGAASMTPANGGTAADMIGDADKALYTAKETGRNKVCS